MPIQSYQVSLKVILRDAKGRVLGLNGKIGGLFEGYYDIPGGRIDESEFDLSFYEVLQREVREELGSEVEFAINPTPVALGRHTSREGYRVLYVFFEGKMKDAAVDFTISAEHVGWAWLDLAAEPLDKLFTSGILEGMKQWYTARHTL